jgi:hypothetical protein
MTIDAVRNRIENLAEDKRPAGVVVAILTDGLENSSREYTRRQVFDRIREQRADGWEFVFLGAEQDAVRKGGRLGVAPADARRFARTAEGVREAWSGISGRTADVRRRRRKTTSGSDRSRIGFKPNG